MTESRVMEISDKTQADRVKAMENAYREIRPTPRRTNTP